MSTETYIERHRLSVKLTASLVSSCSRVGMVAILNLSIIIDFKFNLLKLVCQVLHLCNFQKVVFRFGSLT